MSQLYEGLWCVFQSASFAVPVGMLAECSQRREGFCWRSVASCILLTIIVSTCHFVLRSLPRPDLDNPVTYFASVACWGTVIVLLVCLAKFCYAISTWAAAFCGTAGYIIQNMGSTLGGALATICLPVDASSTWADFFCKLAGTVLVDLACYVILVRRVRRVGLARTGNVRMLWMIAVVIFINIIAALPFNDLSRTDFPIQGVVIFRLLHLSTSAITLLFEFELLLNQGARIAVATTERMLRENARQYELSRDSIDAINLKCHDIRHQVLRLKGQELTDADILKGIAREIDVYDCVAKTGNAALDTVLTEKRLICERDNIAFTCVADGSSLDVMDDADIYALFGNMLDNAIEAERHIKPQSDRSMSLTVVRAVGMVSIHMENYWPYDVRFIDGLPETSKDDKLNHGFGCRSMRLVAEKAGGVMTMGTGDGTFFVNILVPGA